jgi:argonaute-like protein implicated in RNA metabolism and viral defense
LIFNLFKKYENELNDDLEPIIKKISKKNPNFFTNDDLDFLVFFFNKKKKLQGEILG